MIGSSGFGFLALFSLLGFLLGGDRRPSARPRYDDFESLD
jgi:hypothetical protein